MFDGNRKFWAIGLLLGALGVLGAGMPASEAPESVRLKIAAGGAAKAPVLFSHRLHEARSLPCQACHHDYRAGRNIWRQGMPVDRCQTCHGLTPRADNRLDLKEAFHRQCKGCHLELRQRRYQAGPTDCRDCHRLG
jgi:hypothetical protein